MLLAGGERLVDVGALVPQPGEELVEVGEAGLEVLDGEQEPAQLLVARGGRVGRGDGGRDGLAEERELGGELGAALPHGEFAAPRRERGPGAVDGGEHFGDAPEDRGAHHGVTDLQGRDHFGQRLQAPLAGVEVPQERVGLGDRSDRLGFAFEFGDLLEVGGERVVSLQVRDGASTRTVERFGDLGGERVDPGEVDVAGLAQRHEVAAGAAQFGEERDPVLGGLGGLAAGAAQQLHRVGLRLFQGLRGLGGEFGDGGVLVEDRFGGVADAPEALVEAVQAFVAEPRVVVEAAGCRGDERLEDRLGRFHLADHAGHRERVGDGAHGLGVADAVHGGVAGFGRGRVGFGHERGVPDLHRVDAGGLFAGEAERGEGAVVEDRVAVDAHRRRHFLADDVVRQEERAALGLVVEDVEDVFAVGRADDAFEAEVGDVVVEGLELALVEVVAAGEDEAVVLGEAAAGLADGVGADDVAGAGVEDQVAGDGLLVGEDPQEQERPDARVRDVGVGEGLEGLGDGLGVDAFAGLGVVLDLDGEVAVDALDEDLVLDGHVRVAAGDVVLAGGGDPLEVVRFGPDRVRVAAGVHIGRVRRRRRAASAGRAGRRAARRS